MRALSLRLLVVFAYPLLALIALVCAKGIGLGAVVVPLVGGPSVAAALLARRAVPFHFAGLCVGACVPLGWGIALDVGASHLPHRPCGLPATLFAGIATLIAFVPCSATSSLVLVLLLRIVRHVRARGFASLRQTVLALRLTPRCGAYRSTPTHRRLENAKAGRSVP